MIVRSITTHLRLALAMVVCGGAGCQPAPSVSPLSCKVLIDGQPAMVQLTLLAASDGSNEPLLVGSADATGLIGMSVVEGKQLPEGTDIEFRAVVESIGSGDWTIASPWNDRAKSPLKVKWSRGTKQLDIQLSKKAIKPI